VHTDKHALTYSQRQLCDEQGMGEFINLSLLKITVSMWATSTEGIERIKAIQLVGEHRSV
jgi:hypothetical protein